MAKSPQTKEKVLALSDEQFVNHILKTYINPIKKNESVNSSEYFPFLKRITELDFNNQKNIFNIKNPGFFDSEDDFDTYLSTQWFNTGELAMVRMLFILKYKVNDLKNRGYDELGSCLDSLHGTLLNEYHNYLNALQISKNTCQDFKEEIKAEFDNLRTEWNKAINQAVTNNPELTKHRGCKNIIAHIFSLFINLFRDTDSMKILKSLKINDQEKEQEKKFYNLGFFKPVDAAPRSRSPSSNEVTL